MAFTTITNRNSPNFTKGRGGKAITGVTIHHWGDPNTNPSAEGVVNWLCNPASQVSAHIVVTGTGRRAWWLVNAGDTAWHAGNWTGNQTTIGIECDPRCRPEDYDVVAEQIADIWRVYGKLPLYPHKHWKATACPGNYDINHLYNLASEKLNPRPTPPPVPVTLPVPNAVKLPSAKKFTCKLAETKVWDLTTNPNYKAVTTLAGGSNFEAYAQIDFNEQVYYVTKYSFDKGLKNGVNARDLNPIVEPPKPDPTPTPEPNPIPMPPVTEQPDYPKENNALLKQILALLQSLVEKIGNIFK